jgi:cbb3-type cytochrome c oxidase subunit III
VTRTAAAILVTVIGTTAMTFGAVALARPATDQQSTQDKPFSLLSPSLYGVDNFHSYCSPCHGRGGKGDGPVAPALKRRPSDLTTLARRNHGVFPRAQVREFITNGSRDIPEHGSIAMPVWGPTFRALESSDKSVAIRIANVVEYLESIQQ